MVARLASRSGAERVRRMCRWTESHENGCINLGGGMAGTTRRSEAMPVSTNAVPATRFTRVGRGASPARHQILAARYLRVKASRASVLGG